MRRVLDGKVWFLALTLVSAAVGCTVEQPTTQHPAGPASADMKPASSPDMQKPDDGIVNPPVLDPVQQITAWDTVPLHGTAEPNGSVIIRDGNGNTVAASVAASGRFCADAPLVKGGINNFTLHSVDPNGNESEQIQLSITQQGTVQQHPTSETAENAAIGGAGTVSFWSWDAVGSTLIDGDVSTATMGDAYPNAWAILGFGLITGTLDWNKSSYDRVMVQLQQVSRVNRIVVKAPSACPLTAPFSLWVSGSQSTSDPVTDPNGWSKLKDFAANSVPQDGLTLDIPAALVGTIAIIFDHGYYTTPWSDDLNCGGISTGFHPRYGISEVQAWTVPGLAPPPPAKPTCNSGG